LPLPAGRERGDGVDLSVGVAMAIAQATRASVFRTPFEKVEGEAADRALVWLLKPSARRCHDIAV
jgi:ribose/xylose/arabinose/galactoside ABC-type transport system permease subunit